MKRIIAALLAILFSLSLSSCGQSDEAKQTDVEPEVSQMKAICELAVMDCYYHNVAKFKEEDAEGFLFWTKDKHFWIEYSGVVSLGVDVSLVTMEVSGDQVTITLPKAKVLSCKVDSTTLTEDSFIVADNSAKIDAEDEVAAFEAAQSDLEETASQDSVLLANAQQRAQSLLEDYIKNVGKMVGKEYTIQWVYLDEDGSGEAAPSSSDRETSASTSSVEE